MAVADLDFRPGELEIVASRLQGVADEMYWTLQRTSFSTIISAALDYGCALMDSKGGQLAHAHGSMALFNLALPNFVRALVRRHGNDIHPGDVFIGNDPWLCAGHLPDVAVVTPVFDGELLVGFAASIAHQSDFGGIHGHNRVREVYEEGLRLPVMKLYDGGTPNEALFEIIEANVRGSELVLGDLDAQVLSNRLGGQRLIHVLETSGISNPTLLVHELQGRSERAVRRVISEIPDGIYDAETRADARGHPTKVCVRVSIRGSDIHVDYDGTDPQLEQGGTNCTLSYTVAETHAQVKAILAPGVPHNEGSTRAIKVSAPKGSLLNCTFPASVGSRVFSSHDALLKALAKAVPDRVMAGTGLFVFPRPSGRYSDGTHFDSALFGGGGQGGSATRDGMGGYIYPSSASNVSIELFEMACPMMVMEKEWLTDSCGAGRHRGGPATRISLRRSPSYSGPVPMRYFPMRSKVAGTGLEGGADGSLDEPVWNGDPVHKDSELVRDGWVTFRSTEDTLTFFAASGGGFGNPRDRSPEAIERDVRQGLLSTDGAKSQYGYIYSKAVPDDYKRPSGDAQSAVPLKAGRWSAT